MASSSKYKQIEPYMYYSINIAEHIQRNVAMRTLTVEIEPFETVKEEMADICPRPILFDTRDPEDGLPSRHLH
jgi:hypothetical protein